MQHTEKIFDLYRELEFDMNVLVKQHNGILRIGASTTVSQYVIPAVLAKFHKKFKDIQVQLITGNTEEIEQSLLNKELEMGIIEGISRNPQLKYEEYLQDELVLVCAFNNASIKKDAIKAGRIEKLSLVAA